MFGCVKAHFARCNGTFRSPKRHVSQHIDCQYVIQGKTNRTERWFFIYENCKQQHRPEPPQRATPPTLPHSETPHRHAQDTDEKARKRADHPCIWDAPPAHDSSPKQPLEAETVSPYCRADLPPPSLKAWRAAISTPIGHQKPKRVFSIAVQIGGRLYRMRSGLRRDEAADKVPARGRKRLGSRAQAKNEHPAAQ